MKTGIDTEALRRLEQIDALIGNTPLLAIRYRYRGGRARTAYAKAEHYNLTGSIKDRMALHILRKGYTDGSLRPGMTIAEATSGNTGISFAALGRFLGHAVTIYMPDWMSTERIRMLECFGARIEPVSREEGGFLGSIARCRELAARDAGVFLPEQFENSLNCEAHYLSTGPEIARQMATAGRRPDAFVAGVGTGGTVMGIGQYLKATDRAIAVHPLEPACSPTLSTGYKTGKHRIQGISDEFIPPIVDLKSLDGIVGINDGDAILMAQMLARELGLGVGISSGANLLGAIKLQCLEGGGGRRYAHTVTVFPDDNKKYLTTDYSAPEPILEHYLTPNVELLDLKVVAGR